MVSLYRDPKGEGVFGAMSSSNGAKMAILSRPDDVEEMKKKILSLESTIKKLQVSMLGIIIYSESSEQAIYSSFGGCDLPLHHIL